MPCVTLLSDFGLQDASVASAKGVLMQHLTNTPIVDITHLIETYHLQQAAYLLASAYQNFLPGTIHVCLFDVFSERTPRLLLCEHNGHYFLSADNGLLSLAFGANIQKVWKCMELKADGIFKDWLHEAGRVAAALTTNPPERLNLEETQLKNAPQHCRPKIEQNTVECQVIHIDRFENVVLNITKDQFEKIGRHRDFRIQFMRDEEIRAISAHYNDVKESDKLCRFNSTGYLEIAINRGKAASLFGLQLYREKHRIYNTIKIFFE